MGASGAAIAHGQLVCARNRASSAVARARRVGVGCCGWRSHPRSAGGQRRSRRTAAQQAHTQARARSTNGCEQARAAAHVAFDYEPEALKRKARGADVSTRASFGYCGLEVGSCAPGGRRGPYGGASARSACATRPLRRPSRKGGVSRRSASARQGCASSTAIAPYGTRCIRRTSKRILRARNRGWAVSSAGRRGRRGRRGRLRRRTRPTQ